MVGLVPLEKEMPESLFSLPGLWDRRKCIFKSREELLMEIKFSDSLTLNFPASSSVRKYVSGFEAPSLWFCYGDLSWLIEPCWK